MQKNRFIISPMFDDADGSGIVSSSLPATGAGGCRAVLVWCALSDHCKNTVFSPGNKAVLRNGTRMSTG